MSSEHSSRATAPAAAQGPEAIAAASPLVSGVSLPCQKSSNSITGVPRSPSRERQRTEHSAPKGLQETAPEAPEAPEASGAPKVAAHHRKAAAALSWNVAELSDRHGLERLGFLTLTFAEHILEPREAQRRMNSLATNVLNRRYPAWLRVFERQKSGRIHYHLLVVCPADIRSGCDFEAFAARNYQSAGPALRCEWAFWRTTAKCYGFGRTELLPIRSTADAAGRYVGKYIGKHLEAREERDKGVRLVSYSKAARMARTRFSWAESGQQWRAGVEVFARMIADSQGYPLHVLRSVGLRAVFGPRWAYEWRELILSLGVASVPRGTTVTNHSIDTQPS